MHHAKVALGLLAATLLGCGGEPGSDLPAANSSLSGRAVTAANPAVKLSLSRAFGLAAVSSLGKCDVDLVPLDYPTAGVAPGEVTNSTGVLLLPSGENCPAGPYPLLAYARGTELQRSRTLADPNDPETLSLAAVYAVRGYAVVATDYLGYGGSRYPYHPYLHADSEASAVIGAIRAAQAVAAGRGVALSGKVMVTGYSQGGHASMAAQRAIERDGTSGINLVAAGHMSGPYNLSQSIISALSVPVRDGQFIAPFFITAWQRVYGNLYRSPGDVFLAPYAAGIESLFPGPDTAAAMVESGRIPPDGNYLPKLFRAAYLNDLASNPDNPTIVAARKNDLLGWNPKTKTVLCGGSQDPVVNFAIHAKTAQADFASRGINVPVIDVDPTIRAVAASLGRPVDLNAYHGQSVPLLCMTALRDQLFDPSK